MKINAVDINIEALGAWFANLDDDDQAKFFRGMAAEMRHWPQQHYVSMQFVSVASKLSSEDREYLDNNVFAMMAIGG